MHPRPFDNEPQDPRRQFAFSKLQRFNSDECAEVPVAHVEARRIVIIEVHRDHDLGNSANFKRRADTRSIDRTGVDGHNAFLGVRAKLG